MGTDLSLDDLDVVSGGTGRIVSPYGDNVPNFETDANGNYAFELKVEMGGQQAECTIVVHESTGDIVDVTH